MNCEKCGVEYWTTSQKRKHYAEQHDKSNIPAEVKVRVKSSETKTVQCQMCGNDMEVKLAFIESRKQFTCSGTCRGHFYRNIADAEAIEKAVEEKTTDKLRYTINRVLSLGFKIEIT